MWPTNTVKMLIFLNYGSSAVLVFNTVFKSLEIISWKFNSYTKNKENFNLGVFNHT